MLSELPYYPQVFITFMYCLSTMVQWWDERRFRNACLSHFTRKWYFFV